MHTSVQRTCHFLTLVRAIEGAEADLIDGAIGRIRARLIELEAPADSVESWDMRTLESVDAEEE